MTIYRLRVAGTPAPKGSLKCVGRDARHQLIEDDDGGGKRRWRKTLTEAAQQLAGRLPNGGDAGVLVGVLVLEERPATARGRPLPTRRSGGDVDKHARMCLDALDDADVYVDDSRVVLLLAAKAYAAGPPGAIVYVAPIGTHPGAILNAMLTAAPELHPQTLT